MRHCHTTLLFACAACLLLKSQAAPAAAPPSLGEHVRCGGVPVRVERFLPAEPGRRPAVLLLHGADGMHDGGPLYRALARGLAERGYVAVLVHYFDRTATEARDVPALLERFRAYFADPDASARWRAVQDTFAHWLEAVEAALADVRRHDRVDAGRVALAGLSLGGFLATAAAVRSGDVRCVVSLFGGLPRPLHEDAAKMPPSLLVHGDADVVVPLRETQELRGLLERQRRPCEVKVYKGVGHAFVAPDGERDWRDMLDAQQTVTAFLDRHLGTAPVEQEAEREPPAAPRPEDPQPAANAPPRAADDPPWAGLLVGVLFVAACAILSVALLLGTRERSPHRARRPHDGVKAVTAPDWDWHLRR